MAFCVWLLSPGAAFSEFIQAVLSPVLHSALRPSNIHRTYRPHFVYFIIICWTFGLFPFLACYENTAVNIHVHICVWTYVFSSRVVTCVLRFENLPDYFLVAVLPLSM